MCDTFVALPSVTADGSVIFGKNSDREPNEAQALEYHPPADHPAGSLLRSTYLTIPQAPHTYGVLVSRPFWMWGAEMGANERGVVIGNESVFTRLPKLKEQLLTGMDLLRLALERSAGSQAAVETIVTLLGEHGQGGPCGYEDKNYVYHNSFLIADPQEAWVLETAGPFWAARRVRDSYSISNGLTIGEQFDECHPQLLETAQKRGWLRKGEKFHFARCYSDWFYTNFSASRKRRMRSEQLLKQARADSASIEKSTGSPGEGLTVAGALAILRDHGGLEPYLPDGHLLMNHLCAHSANGLSRHATQTTGSLVAHLSEDLQTYWVTGTSAPCTSLFKPVWLGDRVLPDLGPTPKAKYERESLWWRHEDLHRRILLDYPSRIGRVRQESLALEEEFRTQAASVRANRRFSVTESSFQRGREAEERWLAEAERRPLQKKPGLLYQRYWSAQNRSAGIAIPSS